MRLIPILALFCTLSWAQETSSQVPTFQLPDLAGNKHASQEYQGKYLVLDFWATWCTTCRNVVKATQELRAHSDTSKFTVVGVSIDKGETDKVASFAKKLKMDWTILLDPDNTLAPKLGFEAVPSVFFFSPDGKLLASMKGFDPDKEKELMATISSAVGTAK